jgi:hypothetical protein
MKAPPKRPPARKSPPKLPGKKIEQRIPKTFTVEEWDGSNDGEKILGYAESGMGKTTLGSLAPNPVFVGLDDGGRKLLHPVTGKNLKRIKGIETFQDVRDALHSTQMLEPHPVVVIDTGTDLQTLAEPYVFDEYPLKDGSRPHSIRQYGWGDGYGHLVDVMRLVLQDCDALVRTGKTVMILNQLASPKKANAGGFDFLQEGPDLFHRSDHSVRNAYISWADHVIKIDYLNAMAGKDKKATGNVTRAIFVKPEVHFVAKSRTLEHNIISFEDKTDNSFWRFLFNGENNEQ